MVYTLQGRKVLVTGASYIFASRYVVPGRTSRPVAPARPNPNPWIGAPLRRNRGLRRNCGTAPLCRYGASKTRRVTISHMSCTRLQLQSLEIHFEHHSTGHSASRFANHSTNHSEKHPQKHFEKHPEKHLEKHPEKHPKSPPQSTPKSPLKSTRKMPTPAPTTILDLALFLGLIQHHPDYRLLYCQPCTAVVFIGALWRHLRDHHQVPLVQRKLLLQHCQSLDLIPTPEDLQLPIDHSPALQFLPVHQGYSCRQCRYLTSCKDSVRRHINTTHKLY
jgi:Orsellinic acid/F9775 biosynthesis cluster protein D